MSRIAIRQQERAAARGLTCTVIIPNFSLAGRMTRCLSIDYHKSDTAILENVGHSHQEWLLLIL